MPQNPQLAAAIDLVDDDIEHLDLPPETEYALKVQEAADLLQSAQRELAMAEPQSDEPVVAQLANQINQATQGGLPEMAQRLQPGHQQLGINQQRRVQQALGGGQGRGGMPQLAGGPRGPGGLPQLSSNLRPQMAAQGGIVGYQAGGDITLEEIQRRNRANEEYMRTRPTEHITLDGEVLSFPGGVPTAAETRRRYQTEEENTQDDRASAAQGEFFRRARRGEGVGLDNPALKDLYRIGEEGTYDAESEEYLSTRPIPALINKYGASVVMGFLEGEKQLRAEAQHVAPQYADAFQQKRDNFYSHFPREFIEELYETRGGPIDISEEVSMAGGGPIKRYQTGNQVRGDTPPGRMPIIHKIEQGLGNIGTQIRGSRESTFKQQELMRLVREIMETQGLSYEEAIVMAGQQLGGGLGEQAPIERPRWFDQIPAGQVDPEIGTQVRGPTPEGGGGQEPDVPPQDVFFPQELPRAVASREVAALPYEKATFNAPQQQLYDWSMEEARRDPVQEGIAAGQRVRDLMGADDLMARRAEEFEGLQSLRAEQFSPKESLRRRWHAGLQQGQKQGLGGFGAGVGMEEDKILAERLGVREASVEHMDKLIAELRTLGLSQYQAEQEAQKMVATLRSQGISTAQALQTALRATDDANLRAQAQIDVARETGKWQEKVAQIRNLNNTDMMDQLQILARKVRRENPGISPAEADEKALEMYYDQQIRAAFARLATTEDAALIRRDMDVMREAVRVVDQMSPVMLGRRGIMSSTGQFNEDAYTEAIDRTYLQLMKTVTGTPPPGAAPPGDDRLTRIRERLQNPDITMEQIRNNALTPEELTSIADIFVPD